jgi:TRAP-type C4-dicarboxylate transport system permease small subunit
VTGSVDSKPPATGLLGSLLRLRGRIDRVLEVTLVALMTVMVVNVLWQVCTRFLLRSPSSFTEELARFLLIWLGLLGACYALRHGMHLAVEVLVGSLEGWTRRAAELASLLGVAGFAIAVLGVGGLNLVGLTRALEQTSPALGVSLAYVYMALPLTALLVLFYVLIAAVELLVGEPVSSD